MEELKLEHIAGYLPYKLKIKTKYGWDTMTTLNEESINVDHEHSYYFEDNEVKPILKPMTKEVLEEVLEATCNNDAGGNFIVHVIKQIHFQYNIYNTKNFKDCPKWIIDRFHKHHVDYKDLIGQGLAVNELTLKQ